MTNCCKVLLSGSQQTWLNYCHSKWLLYVICKTFHGLFHLQRCNKGNIYFFRQRALRYSMHFFWIIELSWSWRWFILATWRFSMRLLQNAAWRWKHCRSKQNVLIYNSVVVLYRSEVFICLSDIFLVLDIYRQKGSVFEN